MAWLASLLGSRPSLPLSSRGIGRLARIAALAATAAHGGCSMIPTSGPASAYVLSGQLDPESLPYSLVKLTPEVVAILDRNSARIGRMFTDRRGPTEIRFGTGDVVSVTLFESAAGGLFIPLEAGVRPGNFVTLPNQAVDTQGNITVPYAGPIQARGKTAVEVQKSIVNALKDRALEPQAVVALVDQRASSLSVLGEVGTPARLPVSQSGERLLDAIARAGGPKNPGYDTWVMLDRAGRQALAPFAALVNEPSNNIYVRPQDTIYVFTQPADLPGLRCIGPAGPIPVRRLAALARGVAGKGGRLERRSSRSVVCISVSRGAAPCRRAARGRLCALQRPICPDHLQLEPARPCRIFPGDEIRDAEQGRDPCLERVLGRVEQIPDISAVDHRDRQRSADGRR